MSPRKSIIFALPLILFASCSSESVNITTTKCGTDNQHFAGIITTSLSKAEVDQDNVTHSSGYCIGEEQCVSLLNAKNQVACSKLSYGKLLCNSSEVNALTDAKHCGDCNTICYSDQVCQNGKCVSASNTSQNNNQSTQDNPENNQSGNDNPENKPGNEVDPNTPEQPDDCPTVGTACKTLNETLCCGNSVFQCLREDERVKFFV